MNKRSIFFILISVAIFSCRKERDLTYQGPDVLEFSNPITGTLDKLTGQSIGGASVLGDNANIPIRGDRDSVVVNLVGRQRSTPINVKYEVVTAGSTAVEGVDYEFVGTKGNAMIAANSSTTAVYFRSLNASVNPADVKRLNLRLTGSDLADVGVSENYKTFAVSIFPMKAYVDKTLGAGRYFSSRNGEVYANPTGNPQVADIAYTVVTRTVNGTATEFPTLISPFRLVGGTASDSKFSQRVFTPAANVPDYLQYSYATLQLANASSVTVNAIPVTGTTATAAVNPSVEIVRNGIYGFVNAAGKKAYIRIKSITAGAAGSVSFDIMTQP